jgi:hypothetical protein
MTTITRILQKSMLAVKQKETEAVYKKHARAGGAKLFWRVFFCFIPVGYVVFVFE